MTPEELQAWQERMGLTPKAAAEQLGVSLATYYGYLSGKNRNTGKPVAIDRQTALACAALEAGLMPIGGAAATDSEERRRTVNLGLLASALNLNRKELAGIVTLGGLKTSTSQADRWLRSESSTKGYAHITDDQFHAFCVGLKPWLDDNEGES
ncbi:hypothetical protein ACIPTP_21810 [Pectobacterium versatile]|uniref:hypothetical protein n=1 Tax=Pectobacterium versatile TaxID=2488639 RepID=UPI00381E8C20